MMSRTTENPLAAMASQSSSVTGAVGSAAGSACAYSPSALTLVPRSST